MRKSWIYRRSAVVVMVAAVAGLQLYVRSLGARARTRVVKEMGDRFDSDVTLGSLQLSLFPSPGVSGGPLSIQHRGWKDMHPLLTIARFTAESSFFSLLFQRDKVKLLRLEGLQIHLPHRGKSTTQSIRAGDEEVESGQAGNDRSRLKISIQTIVADGSLVEIEPKQAGKDPLRFDIGKLTLHSAGSSEAMKFDAILKNPKPPGLINTSGLFGPWQKDDPRATSLSGNYEFKNADLGVFKGISGMLSSTGTYSGVLQRINVKGATDTPDFALQRGGAPVHLKAAFQSIVNGMNGDTILENVDAHFLHSEFLCKGEVTQRGEEKGKTVSLFAATRQPARMEDILQLVVGYKEPMMRGAVQFQSTIVIPPGKEDVVDKLRLQGGFSVTSAIFASAEVKRKVALLSHRARGIKKRDEAGEAAGTVASDLRGKFKLRNGEMTFSPLSFAVRGAMVELTGTFKLPSQQLNLAGIFRMQSTLSETQPGIKHLLLKPLDPAFRKDGAGMEVPFKVTGTPDRPTLSVSAFHHTFRVK